MPKSTAQALGLQRSFDFSPTNFHQFLESSPTDFQDTKSSSDSSEINSNSDTSEVSNYFVDTLENPHETKMVLKNTNLVTRSLDDFQTAEQRRVLDTVANVRKCGLDSFLSLPQIVVCGDQSSGKSSVLEALTEINFPRSDNLCTRYATEIILRRADNSALTIKIIPDSQRPPHEQASLESFSETITDFEDLPDVMDMANDAMGIEEELTPESRNSAFSRDVLSITMEGPNVPQLTLVDIPGLIANATMGVSEADVEMVGDITNHYISQSRTICLAVISATNDHANQSIVTRIKKYDPHGDRTLGVITKPDRLEVGSASEKGFIALAQNKDINYKLGWHVLKNRSHAETNCSLEQRNILEMNWLKKSNFNVLPPDSLGIRALRNRLSKLLFEHVKYELPKLRRELEDRLAHYRIELENMGESRATSFQCRRYLTSLSQNVREVCKAAVDGHYQSGFFYKYNMSTNTDNKYPVPISRIRAIVQGLNAGFATRFRDYGRKYEFSLDNNGFLSDKIAPKKPPLESVDSPIPMSKVNTIDWVSGVMNRSRGRELYGNFNPLLVGELFWEQSSKWKILAQDHMDSVSNRCTEFLTLLLKEYCPGDVETRLWNNLISETLQNFNSRALKELEQLNDDIKSFPINYNDAYIKKINHHRQARLNLLTKLEQQECENHENNPDESQHNEEHKKKLKILNEINIKQLVDRHSCEEVFDSLIAIYEVQQEVYIANVTTQVVERHIVRNLAGIFDPVAVSMMTDEEVNAIAQEPISSINTRDHIQDRINRLQEGKRIFHGHSRE